ncbi:MAG: SDR family oxidoreductase [Alphaproteobacteria bacterium]|nr:SDR family oxidoreductase [Alphaproteobacteria bacterium]
MSQTEKKLFCFGYGYTCDYLSFALEQEGGWSIAGTTRDPEKRNLMRSHGVKSFLFDTAHPLDDPQYFLKDVTHLLISIPPGDEGGLVFNLHAAEILKIPTIEWIGYLSSTSVYGDRGGLWVDETSEIRPTSKRGSRRALAEQQWLSLAAQGAPVHIFRLAGIYGPGRSALDTVRAGIARRIDKTGHVFSRVHVEDIVQVLIASMHHPSPGSIYNVCDDHPGPSQELVAYACILLGMEPPPLIPFDQADMAPMARSFYEDNKRIHNDKIKESLHVHLKYPDYRSGLEACLAVEQQILSALKEAR